MLLGRSASKQARKQLATLSESVTRCLFTVFVVEEVRSLSLSLCCGRGQVSVSVALLRKKSGLCRFVEEKVRSLSLSLC